MRNGVAFQLTTLERHTCENESGLLPTPTTQEIEHHEMTLTDTGRRLSKNGVTSHSVGLADYARLFPTPLQSSAKQGMNQRDGKRGQSLIGAAKGQLWQTPVADDAVSRSAGKFNSRGEPKLSGQVKLWPTPKANENPDFARARNQSGKRHSGDNLATAVHTWPTPTVNGNNNRKGASPKSGDGLATAVKSFSQPESDLQNGEQQEENNSGQLNPTWVEWLMGYPLGWTELRD